MSDADDLPDGDQDDSDIEQLELLQTAYAADPPEMRALKARHRRESRDGDAMWRSVLAAEVGRRELWKILVELGTFEERFGVSPSGGSLPEKSWFHAGEKSAGQRLYHQWLKIDHANVYLMHLENDPRFAQPRAPRKRRSE